jgi:3-dehydroquinate dehydratase-1
VTTVLVGGVELGTGRPKVCVPLTGSTLRELGAEAAAIRRDAADLVELRVDRLAAVDDIGAVREAIALVHDLLDPALPVLLTLRTAAEGGRAIAPAAYRDLLTAVVTAEGVAAIDVETALPRDVVDAVVAAAHEAGRPVVASFHDLAGTPSRAEIVERLVAQQRLGADVVKLACSPASPADVLTLLAATREYADRPDAQPAITMAMGPLGVISRIAGETFGSAVTFGTVGAASAPGQVDAVALRAALDLIHAAQPR